MDSAPRTHTRATTDTTVDRWERLPQHFRVAASEAVHARAHELFEGVAGYQGPWRPLRPFVFDRARRDELGHVSARAMELVLDACRRRADTLGQLQERLGIPSEHALLFRSDDPISDDLLAAARPDIIYTEGTPKFVEFNIDGSIGGTLQTDLLAERFAAIFEPLGPPPSLATLPSAVDARFAAIATQLRQYDEPVVAIPVFHKGAMPGLEQPEAYLTWLEPMCDSGRRNGLDTIACRMDQLEQGPDRTLRLGDKRVNAVLRLFLSLEQPATPGLAALTTAVRAGTVKLHTPEATWLLSDKTILAWLWEDLPHLSPADRTLVEHHVPWTRVFPHPDTDLADQVRDAQTNRTSLVLKPTGGYGGGGVVLGPAVDDEQWHAALRDAAQHGSYILQQHITPDSTPMDFVHLETGQTRQSEVPYVVGPFMFDREISALVVRHGAPGTGPVLNARYGALANTVMLADE